MDNIMQIEYVPLDELKPYARNAKLHPAEQIEQIKESIRQVGFRDPIGLWHGEIVEGHGRYIAAQELELAEVPVIRFDDMTDKERRAYALWHNKLTMNSDFDKDLLDMELQDLDEFDMGFYGFEIGEIDEPEDKDNPYTKTVKIPQYEPSGDPVDISELVNTLKTDQLISQIRDSSLPEKVKRFLEVAAYRHAVFNYKKIADFYAQADAEVQELMEESALVIIDIDDAIAKGYAVFSDSIQDIAFEGEDE